VAKVCTASVPPPVSSADSFTSVAWTSFATTALGRRTRNAIVPKAFLTDHRVITQSPGGVSTNDPLSLS
jgi:hypothetical protein